MEGSILTVISNPIFRASSFISSRSNSTERSFVLLFSQCQSSGPWEFTSSTGGGHLGNELTKVDPDPTFSENFVDDAKVVHDIFGLSYRGMSRAPP